MLSAILFNIEDCEEERFEILDNKSAQKWYLKRGFKKVLRKESTHSLTFGEMSSCDCFMIGKNKTVYLKNRDMTPTQKKALLAKFIELHVLCGFDITECMGKPLSYFDYDKVKARIERLKKEYQIND